MLILIAAAVCMMSAGTGTAENVNITSEGHFGSSIHATAVSGNYAYVGQGQDLVVLDVSNPSQPFELGRIYTLDFVYDIKISGSYAYFADHWDGLVIVDVSNPAAPTLTSSYNTAGCALGVAVSGSYAYVADYYNGLVIVDISNPTVPTLAGSYDTARYARGVTVLGSYAYVADDGNCLVIIDISNPDAPPTLTITSPTAYKTVSTSTISVTGIATDDSGITSLTVNGNAVTLETDGSFSTTVSLKSGVNTITVVATYAAGNSATEIVTVRASLPNLLFAITPNSRLAQVGTPVTIFMSVINAGTSVKSNL